MISYEDKEEIFEKKRGRSPNRLTEVTVTECAGRADEANPRIESNVPGEPGVLARPPDYRKDS